MQNRKRDTDVQNRLWDSVGEGKTGMFWENSIEASILSRVKQTTSPGWMHETSAQGWCTGKTQRDGMGVRQEGGSGWGTHVNPWLIHINVWQKPLQYCKVISLQLIKINEKTNKQTKNSCPLSRWYHPTISSSVVPFSSRLQSSTRVFSNESALNIRWPKYWSFSFNISPSNEYSGQAQW